MRVAFLTNLTARASLPVLERLATSPQVKLQHIFFYNTLSAGRAAPLQILREFGLKTLVGKMVQIAHSQLRVRLGRLLRGGGLKPHSAYEYAVFQNLPHSLTDNMNSDGSYELLQHVAADVLVVCVCKNILRGKLLSMPGLQFVNIHPSLLPHYRGPSPTFWMLYHGEQQTGFTIHHMTTEIDRGAILAQAKIALDNSRSELEIELQVFAAASEVLVETLLNLNEQLPGEHHAPHDSAGSYHPYPTQHQRQELYQRRTAKHRR